VSYERDDFSTATGQLVALSAIDGSVIWDVPFDSMVLGAATVVGDLVFTSTLNGLIYALRRDTGAEVWRYQAPAGINAWPAVVDDTILIPAGLQTGDSPPVLLALRLRGSSAEANPPASEAAATEDGARDDEVRVAGVDSVVTLSARDLAFDAETITVGAGSRIAVELINHDGVLHNVAFYATRNADEPIGVGEVFAGPGVSRSMTFEAPEQAGTYFFRCDTHPLEMTGDLVVE
jgi:plastocyanin